MNRLFNYKKLEVNHLPILPPFGDVTSAALLVHLVSVYQLVFVCRNTCSILMHSNTAAPTELLLVAMEATMVHLFSLGSYFSTEFKLEEPSFPPSA